MPFHKYRRGESEKVSRPENFDRFAVPMATARIFSPAVTQVARLRSDWRASGPKVANEALWKKMISS
jgi:hypothetical protein